MGLQPLGVPWGAGGSLLGFRPLWGMWGAAPSAQLPSIPACPCHPQAGCGQGGVSPWLLMLGALTCLPVPWLCPPRPLPPGQVPNPLPATGGALLH